MKKISKYLLVLFVAIVFGMINAKADEKYVLYECLIDNEKVLYYHLANHEPNPICVEHSKFMKESITFTGYGKYTVTNGTLLGYRGNDFENADKFTDHYPKFLIVAGNNDVDIYGYDSLDSARTSVLSETNPKAIYINENYLTKLKSEVSNFDKTQSKTCTYENLVSDSMSYSWSATVSFNKDGYYLSGSKYSNPPSTTAAAHSIFLTFGSDFLTKQHKEILAGECPNLYVCYQPNTAQVNAIVFNDSLSASSSLCKGKKNKTIIVNSSSCLTYMDMISEMKYSYKNFDKTVYNKIKDQLSDMCRFTTSQNSYKDPCLQSCLSLNKDIAEIEGKEFDTSACGFSQKILIWVENILRLVKYIVPVILIVLSILDFIKALAAEKEDDMKKAQKHFVIRLVAAVLIFLMPIILSFVMDKMGFSAESCGIKGIGF